MIKLVLLASAFVASAQAEPLKLNDLPSALASLRQCTLSKGVFGGSNTCVKSDSEVWASVNSDGSVLIVYRLGGANNIIHGRGNTVDEALRDLSVHLNAAGAEAKRAVESIAPLLPTQ